MRVYKFLLIKDSVSRRQKTLKNFIPVKVVAPDFIPEDYDFGAVLNYFKNSVSKKWASTHYILMIEDDYEYFKISPGEKIAVIGTVNAYITELTE